MHAHGPSSKTVTRAYATLNKPRLPSDYPSQVAQVGLSSSGLPEKLDLYQSRAKVNC